MKITTTFILLLCTALLVVFAGCAFENQTLVSIDGESFTVADFNDRYEFTPTDDSLQRVEKVREFIDQMLMVHEGLKRGYENDPVVQTAFEAHKKELIYRGYYEAKVIDKVKVSESEIRAMYNEVIDKYHLAQVVVDNDSLAQYIQTKINKGVPFESLLVFSLDTLTENGDIGEFSVISLPPEILAALRKKKDGETTDMITFGNYYYFLKIVKHYTADEPKFEDVKELISNNIRREKIGEAHEKFVDKLLEDAKVEYNDAGLQALTKPDSLITEDDLNLWVVKKYDTSYVLVRTIRDAVLHQYKQSFIPPEQLIERVLVPDLIYDQALKEHFEMNRKLKRQLDKALATLVYQKVYNEMVHEQVTVDSMEVVDYFEKRKDAYEGKQLGDVYSVVRAHLRSEKIDALKKVAADQLREKYPPKVNETVLVRLLKEER
jgi:hypothetical protein